MSKRTRIYKTIDLFGEATRVIDREASAAHYYGVGVEDLPKTFGEAMAEGSGWTENDQTWEYGYVSRKTNINDCPIYFAGGSRFGEIYALLPSWRSTTYCVRVYLKPKSWLWH